MAPPAPRLTHFSPKAQPPCSRLRRGRLLLRLTAARALRQPPLRCLAPPRYGTASRPPPPRGGPAAMGATSSGGLHTAPKPGGAPPWTFPPPWTFHNTHPSPRTPPIDIIPPLPHGLHAYRREQLRGGNGGAIPLQFDATCQAEVTDLHRGDLGRGGAAVSDPPQQPPGTLSPAFAPQLPQQHPPRGTRAPPAPAPPPAPRSPGPGARTEYFPVLDPCEQFLGGGRRGDEWKSLPPPPPKISTAEGLGAAQGPLPPHPKSPPASWRRAQIAAGPESRPNRRSRLRTATTRRSRA